MSDNSSNFTLASESGLVATLSPLGAALRSLTLSSPPSSPSRAESAIGAIQCAKCGSNSRAAAWTTRSVVLGLASDDAARRHAGPYLGVTVGRVANRIGHGGEFELDGERHQARANEGGNCLHGGGGDGALDGRVWEMAERVSGKTDGADAFVGWPIAGCGRYDAVTFASTMADGENGFPGRVNVRATYVVAHGAHALGIVLEGEAEAVTLLALTNHAYFNLSGEPREGGLADHQLDLHEATGVLAVDDALIPTGEVVPLAADSPFAAAVASLGSEAKLEGLDHNYVLAPPDTAGACRCIGALVHVPSGLRMRVTTTKPGVQVYTGNGLGHAGIPIADTVHAQCASVNYGNGSAICLETQFFPDAIHLGPLLGYLAAV
ncbi:aldose 1-epimerase [Thecamonas trahens ATCC 50062]|uniref:Aldose 1-epimerase n=1 Tax=Thecamonas trahens ATCC 50062 TaxID=461836 RepID=A0A0L0D3S5_THETB|nr:aldose 1-epimerase [Thecamonas trahens ATCC 50062]KNC46959.1 aldose 1-epimerase [Thecamonas trahens ATCC 50062]|eukprot:XP_013760230.1 aldose 1-epimerase [Thecamonas trahens ATCC 50062]